MNDSAFWTCFMIGFPIFVAIVLTIRHDVRRYSGRPARRPSRSYWTAPPDHPHFAGSYHDGAHHHHTPYDQGSDSSYDYDPGPSYDFGSSPSSFGSGSSDGSSSSGSGDSGC